MRFRFPLRWFSKALLCLLVFMLGGVSAVMLNVFWPDGKGCAIKYNLINAQLPCNESVPPQGEWDYEPLRDRLDQMKADLVAQKKITQLSVYFRDLDNGPRFGIGEYDKFQPASLLKVPIMIAFLHEADRNPKILAKQLSYTGSLNILENVEAPTDESIEPNTPYTIYELIEKMIIYSDNYSYLLLVNELNAEAKESAYFTFRDLGILTTMLAPKADHVSIQSYSNLFAVLYNTGYLSKERSQLALSLLSQSTFREGLVAGVPSGTVVAHKFGRKILDEQTSQLHDCGIVYHPTMTYSLCVMTSGDDYGTEKAVIADLSKAVYDGVTALHLQRH